MDDGELKSKTDGSSRMDDEEPSRPVVLVSNRLPLVARKKPEGGFEFSKGAGGLVTALESIHGQKDAQWIGYGGVSNKDSQFARVREHLESKRMIPIPVDSRTYHRYYSGMSNGTLWPVFHSFWESATFNTSYWEAYQRTNEVFAETIAEKSPSNAFVWIHDYQLMLVPELLRKRRPDLRIAFFLHIPFPEPGVFSTLPWAKTLMEGLLGADLIGVHTRSYVDNFLRCLRQLDGPFELLGSSVQHDGRLVQVSSFPLGADATTITKLAKQTDAHPVSFTPTEKEELHVFLGVDRLDYTKGIIERLKAYQKLLREYPDTRGEVRMVQVCVPSRTEVRAYQRLKRNVEQLVGEINGEFERPGYHPLTFMYQSLPQGEVVSFYKMADTMLVTPLRDGLNLVCKEYVLARDKNFGALVLSKFAGAAETMGASALLVNPNDVAEITRQMHYAFRMPEQEKARRMAPLLEELREKDNLQWARSFMAAWKKAAFRAPPLRKSASKRLINERFKPKGSEGVWSGDRARAAYAKAMATKTHLS